MSYVTHRTAGAPDHAAAAAFAETLARAHAGTPTLLLLAGSARDVRTTLAATMADALLGRGTRVVEIEPDRAGEYDPVATAARMWRKGARRVAFSAQQRDIAWGWLALVPLGDLVSAIGETLAVIGRRRAGGDGDLARLLRAAKRRTLVIGVQDLHVARRAGALRLGAAIETAPAGTRLLVVGGADPAMQDGRTPAIFDVVTGLPRERVHVLRVARDHGAVDRLRDISPDAAAAVQAAAVLGSAFDGAALARLLGIDELVLEDRLAIAVRAGLLRVTGTIDLPDGDVATAWAFEPPALRDTVYEAMPAAARESLHARID